ncbi:MAG: AtpZ/AtpI family protein [Lachnospiraceae bacterium]
MKKNRKEERKDASGKTVQMLTLITQFGINMLVPIFLCFFLGMFLDRKLGTNFLMIVFFFVGAFAGFRNIYLFSKKNLKSDSSGTDDRRGEISYEEQIRQIRDVKKNK